MKYYQILNDWDVIAETIPDSEKDIFFTTKYHKLFLNIEKAIPEAFVYEKNKQLILLPYLKRKLKTHIPSTQYQSYFDLTSPYGYTGIYSNTDNREILIEFIENFKKYCKKNNIVSGFFRIHPLVNQYFNKNLLYKKTVNKLVTINLEQDPETIFQSLSTALEKASEKLKKLMLL